MSAVHGYKAVGFLNGGLYVALPTEDKARTEMLSRATSAGLTILYTSQQPKGCPAQLAGGHVGGGLRCERGCRTLHACAARLEQAPKAYACNLQLRAEWKPYPPTCQQCGLGPCHNTVTA